LKKRIAILGSTGSIGCQALEVVDQNPEKFEVEVLTAQNNADLLINQAVKYNPNVVIIGQDQLYDKVFQALDGNDVKVYAGEEALEQVVEMDSIDMVLMALVGFAGLKPTISAIQSGKHIALANKECLVVAGELVTKLVARNKVSIVPVDSEHSAIFQCLAGESINAIEKVILTASGGPFRGFSLEQLKKVTKDDALNHPNWDMGNKITIDSATLMNKGLEVIEARWLFGLSADQIEVVVHPQSIIHSMVQFVDGSMKAQMSLPDMRMPIHYALSYPERIFSGIKRFDFENFKELTFEAPDIKKFRNLALAFEALEKGKNIPCVLNAANEVAVNAFLNNQIDFLSISDVIENTISCFKPTELNELDDYVRCDQEARDVCKKFVSKY